MSSIIGEFSSGVIDLSRLYIRLMTGFFTHRKTMRLFARIGSDAFWLPPRLWTYCAENQPDGDLSDYQSDELAALLGYKADAKLMLQALKDCGFIDLDDTIHGWMEHNGYHQKYSDRAKTAALARWSKEKPPHTPQKNVQRKGERGDKHCLSIATSINHSNRAPFPSTEAEAVKQCSLMELSQEFVKDCWNKAESRGGKDAKGNDIHSFPSYCRIEWKYEQERRHTQKTFNGKPVAERGPSILDQDLERLKRKVEKL